jgi:hypothetical protein
MRTLNTKSRLVLLVAFLLLPGLAHAQDNGSGPNKYELTIESARKRAESHPHKKTSVMQSFDEGSKEPSETRTWISEVIPPDRQQTFFEVRSAIASSKTERIRIGSTEYLRVGDGQWQKKERQATGSGSGSGNTSVEYKRSGKKVLNGMEVDVYERISRSKISRKGISMVSVHRTQYYIGSDGELLKEIYDSDDSITKRTHSEITYEPPTTTTIEAPIP